MGVSYTNGVCASSLFHIGQQELPSSATLAHIHFQCQYQYSSAAHICLDVPLPAAEQTMKTENADVADSSWTEPCCISSAAPVARPMAAMAPAAAACTCMAAVKDTAFLHNVMTGLHAINMDDVVKAHILMSSNSQHMMPPNASGACLADK